MEDKKDMEIDVYTDDIDMYIRLFQEEQGIEDIRLVSQSVWNGCLMYVCKHLYKNKDTLKITPNTLNAYNIDLISDICDYYIYLCGIYDKECSIVGFCNLTGLSQDTIFQWSKDSSTTWRDGSPRKLSAKSSEIWQKLHQARENSLSDKLISSKGSPIGIIAALNHRFGWSSPYVAEKPQQAKRIAREELQALPQSDRGEDLPQLPS